MILLLPFFGKHLEKAECFAWKPQIINKAKKKMSCLKPNDIFFLIFCHFWKNDPHFPSSLQVCLSLSVLSLGLPPPLSSPPTTICNPSTFHLLRLPPTRTFRSFQKECSSRYHQFIGLCFNMIVRRNIHFSVFPTHSVAEQLYNFQLSASVKVTYINDYPFCS